MTIEEFKDILSDKTMAHKKTNIRIIEDKTVDPGRLTLAKLHKELVEFKDIVLQFIVEQKKFNARQEKRWEKQEHFNKKILNRLDNIVKKNNLKE